MRIEVMDVSCWAVQTVICLQALIINYRRSPEHFLQCI